MKVNGQLHAPATLPRCPLDRRLCGPQSQSERGGEELNSSPAGNGTWPYIL